MTARSLGEVLGGLEPAKRQRSFQPVRRNSYYANDPRAAAVWQPIGRNKSEARAIVAMRMQAAEAYDRQHKEKGRRNGPLGYIGIEVLRELYRMVDYGTGRLEPSINTICERTRRSKQAVVDALNRLQEHGFLVRIRRAEAVDSHRGPQVKQITNAYGFGLPKCVAEKVERKLINDPLPDCELTRRQAQNDDVEAMINCADPELYLKNVAGNDNDELFDVLSRLQSGLAIAERESTKRSESIPK